MATSSKKSASTKRTATSKAKKSAAEAATPKKKTATRRRVSRLGLIKNDPWLDPFADAIEGRHEDAMRKERELTGPKGSLDEFANAHNYFGLHRSADGGWTFREWAPNATAITLVGDFSDWHRMARYELHPIGSDGVWEVNLPADSLHHGDHYKLIVNWDGGEGERIPAYATRVVQDEQTAMFSAQVWDPETPYQWKVNDFHPDTRPLLIYECHIGMAQERKGVDLFRHAPKEIVTRIRMLWNSIPTQLAKENKKFIYGLIREGARAREYEVAITWLMDVGLVYKINRVKKQDFPLRAYQDFSAFKLFIVDIGLLGAMSRLDAKIILEGNRLFEEFKGALTEQYVLQQLIVNPENDIFYWSAENATSELDFLIQTDDCIVPMEVKAEENLQAKSLKVFMQKYKVKNAVRVSMSGFREQDWLTNFPLYNIASLNQYLKKNTALDA